MVLQYCNVIYRRSGLILGGLQGHDPYCAQISVFSEYVKRMKNRICEKRNEKLLQLCTAMYTVF